MSDSDPHLLQLCLVHEHRIALRALRVDRLVQLELRLIDQRRVALWALGVVRGAPEVDGERFHRREVEPAWGALVWLRWVLASIVLVKRDLVEIGDTTRLAIM